MKEYLAELIRPIVIQAVQDALAELNPRPLKRYLTPEEAWTHIKVSRATFYRLVGRGVIEILKIGNKSLVDADRLDEAVEKREIYRYKHYK